MISKQFNIFFWKINDTEKYEKIKMKWQFVEQINEKISKL